MRPAQPYFFPAPALKLTFQKKKSVLINSYIPLLFTIVRVPPTLLLTNKYKIIKVARVIFRQHFQYLAV